MVLSRVAPVTMLERHRDAVADPVSQSVEGGGDNVGLVRHRPLEYLHQPAVTDPLSLVEAVRVKLGNGSRIILSDRLRY